VEAREVKAGAESGSLPGKILALRIAIPVLSVVGAGISAYLTYIHYQGISPVCLPNMKCDVVLSSPYAVMWNVPISILGMAMYLVLACLGFWFFRVKHESQSLVALEMYVLALAGMLFTGYLYYLEIFVLHAFCTWCVASSIVMFAILVLSIFNLKTAGKYVKEIPHFIRTGVSR